LLVPSALPTPSVRRHFHSSFSCRTRFRVANVINDRPIMGSKHTQEKGNTFTLTRFRRTDSPYSHTHIQRMTKKSDREGKKDVAYILQTHRAKHFIDAHTLKLIHAITVRAEDRGRKGTRGRGAQFFSRAFYWFLLGKKKRHAPLRTPTTELPTRHCSRQKHITNERTRKKITFPRRNLFERLPK